VIGTYHHWSATHTHRYLAEFDMRYSTKPDDRQCTAKTAARPRNHLNRTVGPRFGGGLFFCLCKADDLGEAAVELELDAAAFGLG
jgi:hypothetical protein